MNKKTGQILSILLTVASLAFFIYKMYVKDDRKQIIKSATDAYDTGNFKETEQILLEYTKKYPKQSDGWTFLGTVYIELFNDSLAERSFNTALTIDPANSKALTGMGIIKRSQKKYDEAEQLYLKAIDADPENAKSYSSLLVIELKKGNYTKAVALGEKAIGLLKDNNGIKGNLIVAYHYAGLFEKRDKLLKELENSDYEDIVYIKMFIEGSASMDDL